MNLNNFTNRKILKKATHAVMEPAHNVAAKLETKKRVSPTDNPSFTAYLGTNSVIVNIQVRVYDAAKPLISVEMTNFTQKDLIARTKYPDVNPNDILYINDVKFTVSEVTTEIDSDDYILKLVK